MKKYLTKKRLNLLWIMVLAFILPFALPVSSVYAQSDEPTPENRQHLSNLLAWVYQTMQNEYYIPVSQEIYDDFVEKYTADRLYFHNLQTSQTESFVHLGAGLLVNKLKNEVDRFSSFVPPKKKQEYKQQAYSARADLGVHGKPVDRGFEVTRVQKHTDAFAAKIRPGDILISINDASLIGLDEAAVMELLTPEVGSHTRVEVFFAKTGLTEEVSLESKSYFIETVFMEEADVPGTYVLRIERFNQKTPGDFSDWFDEIGVDNIRHLILDLRNNKGGPPLAAKEILGFFTPPQDPLFYIIRRNRPAFLLTAPVSVHHYSGPITVLVNGGTASAAETMGGVLREKGLATIVGRQTAGASYLKSMYDYEDGSTMMIVTSRTFYHNFKVFPFLGLTPDKQAPEDQDILDYAIQHVS